MGTIDFPNRLAQVGFQNIQYKTVVGERRPPLTSSEQAYFRSVIPFWYTMAKQAGVSEEEQEMWRTLAGDLEHPQNVLNSEKFYFRELHAVITAEKN